MEKLVYDTMATGDFKENLIRNIREGKFIHMMKFGAEFSYNRSKSFCLRLLNRQFRFNGRDYKYFYCGFTSGTERCVEIPIVMGYVNSIMDSKRGVDILEVGNVLPYYHKFNHSVVDKYERGKGIINDDIVTFKPHKKYDLIVSISTIEHVGWDEVPKEPGKILKAIKNIRHLLKSGGSAIITIPVSYNREFDRLYKSGKVKFDEAYYMERTGKYEWVQSTYKKIKRLKFNSPFPCANGLIIGIIKN